ncbi:GAF domain-containing protein [Streptomyces formicae]|nr:GAF domain-containing protein [Streptomyces formicae]
MPLPAGAEAPLPSVPPLLEAVLTVGTDLELHATLQHIVDSAARLTGAGYGTLTVGTAGAGGPAELYVAGERPPAGPASASDVIGVPIHVHDEAFGDLLLARKERGAFTEDDRQLLKVLAGQAGIAIGNARLFETARQRERWIEGAAAVTTALLTGEEAADALMTVADRARVLAGAAAGVILQPTEAGGMTIVAAATDGAPHGWGTKSWRGAHTGSQRGAHTDPPHTPTHQPPPQAQETRPESRTTPAPTPDTAREAEPGQGAHTDPPHAPTHQPPPQAQETRPESRTTPAPAPDTAREAEPGQDAHTNPPHTPTHQPPPQAQETRPESRTTPAPAPDTARDAEPGQGARTDGPLGPAQPRNAPGAPSPTPPSLSPNDLIGTTIEPGSAVLEQLLGGEPVFIEDSATDPRMTTHVRARFGPSMMLPLQAGGRLIGTLALPRRRGAPAYTAAERLLATQFASQAALALVLADAQQSRQRLAVFEDRDRIARDLHDLVVQRLFATGMMLESTRRRAGSAKVESTLDHAVDELESTIQEVRTAIFALQQPPADAPTTFRGKVLRETAGAAAVLGIQPSTQFAGAVDTQVTEPVAGHLLAALRRALAATSRRTGVSRVDVTVDARATLPDGRTGVRLTVHDDGATDGVEAGTTVTWQAPL